MIPAKLIKDLEKKGFGLEIPGYASDEEEIIDILKTKSQRIYLAIPLLLQQNIDYRRITSKLNAKLKKEFNKIIIIADKIFKSEGLDNKHLKEIIRKYKLKAEITKNEYEYYHESFKESKKAKKPEETLLEEQIKTRSKLDTNKALSNIFSPGKIRIMEKIFNHEQLTNTELKYYYKSIRPLILSILNESLQKYVRIIESIKKYHL
ncbi:MAG: hypothetical protein Q8N77_06605 [Nanoarchaeota archaeon]|nr:hypothetical protein [Nanoarchaeota archaeon]